MSNEDRVHVYDDETVAKKRATEFAAEDSTDDKPVKWKCYEIKVKHGTDHPLYVVAKSGNSALLRWNEHTGHATVDNKRVVAPPAPAEYLECITPEQFDELCELIKSKDAE